MTYRVLVSLALLVAPGLVSAATALDTNRLQAIAAWLPAKPAGLGRPITDRAAWQQLASSPAVPALLAKAQKLAAQPVPAMPDDLYLDYSRTGNRDHGQAILFARSDRLETLALAECVENRGRFLAPLTETIQTLGQERTWVYPAHDGKLSNFYGRSVDMDLRATAMAWELATVDYLLGDHLSPAIRKLIRDNVRRRVLAPFRDSIEGRRPLLHWLKIQNNWNAVCLAGVTGAALALEDSPQDRAFFIAAAEQYIRNFLSGFTPDGYCSEGIGYWNYGFGHFLMLGETIRQATGGHVDWLADPAAFAPALFCTRTEILDHIYPTLSDCSPGSRPTPQYVQFISERFGLNVPCAPSPAPLTGSRSLASTLFFAFLPHPLPPAPHSPLAADSPLRSWFKDGGVLICRAGATTPFAAVLKGGHNAESHNHNDVGSFSVLAGHSLLICDPGGEVYTARTFGAHRYDSKVLSSYGHAVPVVAGHLQRSGTEAQAAVLRADFTDEQDTLVLDLRSAYPVPELQQLERTFVFHRAKPALTVRDAVRFSEAKSFETALITWADWKQLSETELQFTEGADMVRVHIDTGGLPFTIKAETLDEDVHTRKKPVRLGIALKAPVQQVLFTLTISPTDASNTRPVHASESK